MGVCHTAVVFCPNCSVTCIANAFFDFCPSRETNDSGYVNRKRNGPYLPRKKREQDGWAVFCIGPALLYLCLLKAKDARKRARGCAYARASLHKGTL